MKIAVKLFGVLRIDRFKEDVREYSPGATVQEIITELCIPDDLLGTILVNSVHAGRRETLRDGDSVWLLPILCGG